MHKQTPSFGRLLAALATNHEANRLFWEAGNNLLGSANTRNPSTHPYVAEYLGRLFDANPPEYHAMGTQLLTARTDMRIEHGDPTLVGTESPLNPRDLPEGVDGAQWSQEAVEAVNNELAVAHHSQTS
jgi:hypothetical protein